MNKEALQRYCQSYRSADSQVIESSITNFYASDAAINVVHPFNELAGPQEYVQSFLVPLLDSFEQLRRTEYIAIGGEFDGDEWVACTGYYTGNFIAPWIGIKNTGALAYLRFAEFHRMQNGLAVESYVFLDIPALMMSSGVWPLKQTVAAHAGYRGYLPCPATNDGLVWQTTDMARSTSSLQLTEKMLLNLATEDEAWRAYWH